MTKIRKETIIQLLARIIAYIFEEKLGSKKTQELLERLERKGGKDMILERIREENKALKQEGKRNGIRIVARKMKQKNTDIVFIESVTGLSREEIEKL